MASKAGVATRNKILDASESLILGNGFAATSVDEIVASAGITKGTFFYHFPTKRDLAQSLIERYAEADLEHLRTNLERAEKLSRDPLQQLLIFVGLFLETAEGLTEPYPGCLFATYCYESGQMDAAALDVVASTFFTWREVLGGKLREVVEDYPPRMEVELDALADMLTVVFEGAFIMSRVLKEHQTFARQLRHYKTYLELLFAPA